MNNQSFTTFLATHLGREEEEIAPMVEKCERKEVKKGDYLLRRNEYCRHTFFVEKGLLRQFSLDEKGREHILSFAPESWFVTDRSSAYFNQPSDYFIQALEESWVMLIDEGFVQDFSNKFPAFTEVNNRLLHNHIRHLQNRINLLLSASAEDRYLQFVAMYPDLLLRVPQTMIAAYLGITPESLSRVRRDLALKNFKR